MSINQFLNTNLLQNATPPLSNASDWYSSSIDIVADDYRTPYSYTHTISKPIQSKLMVETQAKIKNNKDLTFFWQDLELISSKV